MFTFNFKLDTGDKNAGTVYLPTENSFDVPVIIYCHGFCGNRELYPTAKSLCDRAIKEGFAFVTFDFFGCGDTGGDYTQMTYSRWKDNLSEIVSWVIAQPFSKNSIIGCFSVSSGTTAALRMACEDDRLSFVISVATAVSAHIGIGEGGPAKLLADNFDSLMSGGTIKFFGIDFGLDFFIDTVSKAPIHSLGEIKCPVLFLQGTADNIFRQTDAMIAYNLLTYHDPKTKSAHIPVENGNHGLDNVALEAVESIFEWLEGFLVANNTI